MSDMEWTPRKPRIPTNDVEEATESYQARMTPLARILGRWSDRVVDSMARELKEIMERTGYDPQRARQWANTPADFVLLNRLQELAAMSPLSVRNRMTKGIMSKVISGRLTMDRAIRELFTLSAYAFVSSIRNDVAGILVGVAEEGMYRGMFMLQKAAGVGWSIDRFGDMKVETFVGHRYSESDVWRFLSPIVKRADKSLTETIDLGKSIDKAQQGIRDIKGMSTWRSKREARTRITELSNDAHIEEYKEAGVKKYVFEATFDERTCPVCGQMDGRKFNVSDIRPGVNYPPMHPNCRCSTTAALSKEVMEQMAPRRVRDRATGKYHEVPQNFTYQDWYRTFGPGRTDGIEYVPKRKVRD